MLDIASFMAAPMAAMWLGDFGADVIKVEHPQGDMMRTWGSKRRGVPLFWKVVGRNKRSVTLDLHTEKGQQLLRQLAEHVDVIVENFRPGKLNEWGLDYSRLGNINPRLVMLSISAFGQTGPYSPRAGFGTLAEAMSGYAHMTGQSGGPPTLPSFGLADSVAGLCGAFAVMVALHERDAISGEGQHIDLALYEPMLLMLGHQFIDFDQLGVVAERMGSRLPFASPRNVFKTRDDRWVAMSSSAQAVFERSCLAIGQPALAVDERFRDNASRTRNADEIDAIFAEWISRHDSTEVVSTFAEHGAALAPIYNVSDVFDDPQVVARESIATVQDPELGPVRMQNVTPRLSRTPGSLARTGPRVGEHTTEVLEELLGLTQEELNQLEAEGVI